MNGVIDGSKRVPEILESLLLVQYIHTHHFKRLDVAWKEDVLVHAAAKHVARASAGSGFVGGPKARLIA